MKIKLHFILAFISMTSIAFSQSTASDWTHTDCNLVNHTLYNYLDSQEVVVMEFVMGCGSCTGAGNVLMSLKDQYNVSHPGKVNFFLMDYYPSNTCVDVNSTWSSYNFDAYFSGCWAEKDYYYPSIYPMPAIVIAAGNYHTVIYDDLSWQFSDSTAIKQAIDQFFVTVGVEESSGDKISLYPNPVNEMLCIDTKKYDIGTSNISVLDVTGKKIPPEILIPYKSDNFIYLSTQGLQNGSYILEIITPSATVREIFIKN